MKVDTTVLTILSNAITEGSNLTLTGQLARNDYERTNKVIEAAGGKWNRKAKAHTFPGDAAEAIEQILLTGEVTIPQDFGYFPTPPRVVARLVELAEVPTNARLLEPSAGRAAIASAFKDVAAVDAVELLDENVAALKAHDWITSITQADFLTIDPEPVYDRVVMNPPFGKQADIRHVRHAARFLKPGGRLVAVMSAGVLFRENTLTRDFREYVSDLGGFFEELPEESFKASGTSVNTVIVCFDAPAANDDEEAAA